MSTTTKRREPTDLLAEILEVVKRHQGNARVTRISYGAGMPVDRLRVSLDRLTSLGLLKVEEIDGRPSYDITARGQEFLTTYWRMKAFTEMFEDPDRARWP
jgi:predicted transcriptional regulator